MASKYRVILSGNIMPECDRQQVVEGLAGLFNSQTSTMRDLLKGNAVPLKKQYDQAQAQVICTHIQQLGAQCRIEEILEVESNAQRVDPVHDSETESAAENQTHSTCTSSETGTLHSDFRTRLMRFVNRNTDYYGHQFSQFTIPYENDSDTKTRQLKFKITWHWPAFFCFFFWALYRKMWLWAALQTVGGIGLLLWLQSGSIYLVWKCIWAVLANFLYFKMAVTRINWTLDNPKYGQYLAKGGVSKRAVLSGVLIALLSSVLISNYMVAQFLDEYGEQIEDVLPASGSQIRGNGLSLERVVTEPKLARTSLILSVLATSIKILLIKSNERHVPPTQSVMDAFVEQLNAREINDGWGSMIRIEQHVDRYVLLSAGPDQVFKTDDDVQQPVTIP